MNKNIHKLLIETIIKLNCTFIAGALLVSCSLEPQGNLEEIQISEETNLQRDLINLIQKVLETGKDSESMTEDPEKSSNIEPISFQELLAYLPESQGDWKAEKPEGKTLSFGDYSVSQVKRSYSQKDRQVSISIFDWTFNSALYLPFLLTTEFSQESTEGYNRGIEIDGFPGREEYNYQTQNGSLNLLINRRFFVRLDGNNIEETELRKWWREIDSISLSEASTQINH